MYEKEVNFVCFNLAGEEYGLDLKQVLGVNRIMEISILPQGPDFIEGTINIRGKIIPVIDLRKRLGMDKKEYTKRSRIIISKLSGVRVGIIVDEVSKVLGIPTQMIEPPSSAQNQGRFLKGVGNLGKGLLLLLDLDKILSKKEIDDLIDLPQKK